MKSRYIPGLDGLRAIAVCTVFVGHVFPKAAANCIGVDMFFALSGFLITRGLADQLVTAGCIDLREFYIRRLRRLAPALVLLVCTLSVVSIVLKLAIGEHLRPYIVSSVVALLYVMDWVRSFGGTSLGYDGWLGHTWSLSVEEQFYLLWPLVLTAAYRWTGQRGAAWCAGCLALLSTGLRLFMLHHGATDARIYNGFDTKADGLLIGCALALSDPRKLANLASLLWPIPALTIACIFVFVPWEAWLTLPSTIISVACAWLILCLWTKTLPWLSGFLELQPLRYLGRISYGLYLWHWPVLLILLRLHFAPEDIATATLAAAITLAAAATSFHLIEMPILSGRMLVSNRLLPKRLRLQL